jgi:hypothetical protein
MLLIRMTYHRSQITYHSLKIFQVIEGDSSCGEGRVTPSKAQAHFVQILEQKKRSQLKCVGMQFHWRKDA